MYHVIITARSLIRRPAFSFTAVLTLAVGVAVTATMFSIVDAVVIRPLPFPDADRLVTVMEMNPATTRKLSLVAPGRLDDWNRSVRAFEELSGSYTENVTDTSEAEPQRLAGRRVAPRFFDVFRMAPLAGRVFTPDEERFGGPAAAVISESLWTQRYGRDPGAVGRRLVLGGTGYTIVGVMPGSFTPAAVDVWLPAQTPPGLLRVRDARFMSGIGRMKRGVTIPRAAADLAQVQQALGERYPATDKGWSVSVSDLKEGRIGEYRRALLLLFGGVALIFAIAVANIAGLMLVQLHRRHHELSIRRAIGGSRWQIVGAVLGEATVIAAVGSIAGAGISVWLVRLAGKAFATVPRIGEVSIDWQTLAFGAILALLAALVFGLWPALSATAGNLAPALAEGGRGASGAHHRLHQGFVVSQVALTLLLAASAGLLLRSYRNLSRVDTGFRSDHVLTFHVGAAWDEDRARVGQMQERFISDLRNLPGVVSAGTTNFLPATGATLRYQITLEGKAVSEDNGKITVGTRMVSGGYHPALGVPLLAGAWCPPLRFDFKAPRRALVSRAFADRYGPDLVGRHLAFDFDRGTDGYEIVGIVGDVIEDGRDAASAPYVYTCQSAGAWPDPDYVVRTDGDPRPLIPAIREAVHRIDPKRAVFGMKMLDDVLAASLDQPRLNARMLTLFAVVAMMLAALGLYAVLMLIVSERTRELGVRMALGAAPAHVVRLVFAGAGRLVLAGVGIGLVLTAALARVLRALLFGVAPLDTWTLAIAAGALVIAAVLAASIPAWRAATIDPIDAIRVA